MTSRSALYGTIALCAFGPNAEVAAVVQIQVPKDFPTIQRAIAASAHGDSILVAPGTYHEAINLLGKRIELRSTSGAELTTIDATGLNMPAVRCENDESAETVIDGFCMTGGVAPPSVLAGGGGMRILFSWPTVRNCIFLANRAVNMSGFNGYGGGMMIYGSNIVVANCAFMGNSAQSAGGAVAAIESAPTFVNCNFVSNLGDYGSAIDALEADVYLVNCIVRNNQTPVWQIADCCTFVTHSNVEGGWTGVNNIDADARFVRAPSPGGDLVWGTADDDRGNLRLRADSPCIDAGDNSAIPPDAVSDLGMFPRLADGDGDATVVVDMGAYERPRPGDINGDGVVNIDDLLIVINSWGPCPPAPALCPADRTDDGAVDIDDLLTVLNHWG